MKERYILTEDTPALFRKLSEGDVSLSLDEEFTIYFDQVTAALSNSLGDRLDVVPYRFGEIDKRLTDKVRDALGEDNNSICICLDRFLLSDIEEAEDTRNRFYRFGICRNTEGENVPRQQMPTFEDQLKALAAKIPRITEHNIIVVDDGIFTGGTLNTFLKLAQSNGIRLNVAKIIGFIGAEQREKECYQDREIVESVSNLYEWIDVRDFTPLGGRRLNASRSNQITSSIPYLYPWSDGAEASFTMEPDFFDISTRLISSFKDMVVAYEKKQGRILTFRTLIKSGFPFPTDQSKSLPVTLNTSVTKYLDMCLARIETERNRSVAIFDMDGTLYALDGVDNGYSGSRLENAIMERTLQFVQDREVCSYIDAQFIVQQGLIDQVGLSQFFAKRYGISRTDYFNEVWNIDPEGLVIAGDGLMETLSKIKEQNSNLKLVLVTASPFIWTQRVLQYLGLADYFELIITSEHYGKKDEVFRLLAERYNPSRMISIGDQEVTDIIPAQSFGISAFLVKRPDDLFRLASNMKGE